MKSIRYEKRWNAKQLGLAEEEGEGKQAQDGAGVQQVALRT